MAEATDDAAFAVEQDDAVDDQPAGDGTASYVYLATRDLGSEQVATLTGIGDVPVRLVTSAGLTAVVSTVDRAEFGEEALRHNLEDLDWLGRIAAEHDRVVGRVSELTTVAPLRLATILYNDFRVGSLLSEWGTELTAALDRVQGCWEWSVKLVTDPRPAAASVGDADQPTSGASYLQRRRAELQRSSALSEALTAMADRTHHNLAERTVASRRLAAQDRKLSGHQGEMILNAAYLVERAHAEGFTQEVERLAAEHPELTVDLNGPWPPYSFATVESRGDRHEGTRMAGQP
ncbi:GvpL/GvpF family gas vesicle protein [Microlunatus soli]|uniref:Gas vesicle synthesis protein GvpL/GvpF n=1 Tax=Microlunatus soli TaxID=630515 RepID=A0A1H1ND96_9ACTN|nr:GvpL/GvpF family gas vesicle protein [Microlunatus soli]SDR96790.1 Gas vesicle synthesis protein GvpL/GvpF [Microlunatus soli]